MGPVIALRLRPGRLLRIKLGGSMKTETALWTGLLAPSGARAVGHNLQVEVPASTRVSYDYEQALSRIEIASTTIERLSSGIAARIRANFSWRTRESSPAVSRPFLVSRINTARPSWRSELRRIQPCASIWRTKRLTVLFSSRSRAANSPWRIDPKVAKSIRA